MVDGKNDELSHDSKETSRKKEEFCVVAILATSRNLSARFAFVDQVSLGLFFFPLIVLLVLNLLFGPWHCRNVRTTLEKFLVQFHRTSRCHTVKTSELVCTHGVLA
jgi:hypothetical protein